MDDYNLFRDMLETWRSTADWVKAVTVIVLPGYLVFLLHRLLRYRAEQREWLVEERSRPDEKYVRDLVEAQMCKIVAEWERARLAERERPWLTDKSGGRPDRLQ